MNKIEIREIDKGKSKIIPMRKMKPLQIARIGGGGNDGIIVMRTSSIYDFEVMNLTSPGHGKCWTGNAAGGTINVELLPDAKLIVQL